MIRLVLFDIDGTLIRTGGAGVKAFARTFAVEFGLEDAVREVSFAGRTDSSLVHEILVRHGIEPSPEAFRRFYDGYVFLLKHFLEHSPGAACVGVLDFIQALQSLPVPPCLGLLTGNIRLGAEIKLRNFQLWDVFRCGAFGDDDEDRNCLARIAKQRGEALLGQNIRGDEVLVVGDTPRDVECARSIQAHVLAVGTGAYSCEELTKCGATWVARTLNDVEARHICGGAFRAEGDSNLLTADGPQSR